MATDSFLVAEVTSSMQSFAGPSSQLETCGYEESLLQKEVIGTFRGLLISYRRRTKLHPSDPELTTHNYIGVSCQLTSSCNSGLDERVQLLIPTDGQL